MCMERRASNQILLTVAKESQRCISPGLALTVSEAGGNRWKSFRAEQCLPKASPRISTILQWVWSQQTLLLRAARLPNFQQVAVVALLSVPSPALCPSWSLWGEREQRCHCFSYQTGNTDQSVSLPGRKAVIRHSACRMMCSRAPSSPARQRSTSMLLGPEGFPPSDCGRGQLCNSPGYFGKTLVACCPADTQPAAGEVELAAGWEHWRERETDGKSHLV